jgi:hypothetical protein
VHLQASTTNSQVPTTNSQAPKKNLHAAQMQTWFGSSQKRFSPIGSGLTNGQGMGHSNDKIGCNGSDEKFPTPHQKHNLEHTKMLTLNFL